MKILIYLFWDLYRILLIFFTKGKLKVSKDESKRRMSICLKCPKRIEESRPLWIFKPRKPQSRCSICMCYLYWSTKVSAKHCEDEPSKW